jgi:phytoene/squalene synthetase
MIERAFGRLRPVADPAPTPPESLELAACYRYCEALARARHHNFPVASLFLSSRLREHIFAVYAFARGADDIVDEPAHDGRRALALDRWEEHLEACFFGEPPAHPVFVALAATIHRFELPITPFRTMLAGFRADLEARGFDTSAELRAQTAALAEPGAHLFLYLSGYRDAAMLGLGGELASGLAMAGFWQDLAEDHARGRLHIPREDLRHFALTPGELIAPARAGEVSALIRSQVARTRVLFERARPLIDRVGDDIAVELAIAWHGGMRILDKLHRAGAGSLTHRAYLTSADKALVVSRALAWRGGSLGTRARGRMARLLGQQ